jgi:predicted RNase H-like nuclease (RuvC/YqgF family)
MSDAATMTNGSEETIRAIARSETKVEALTESMRELKKAVEELIDRVDADIDTLRAKAEGFAVTAANVDDLRRRVTVLETKVETHGTEIVKLQTKLDNAIIDKTKLETKLEAVHARVLIFSGASAVLAWIAGKLFR